MAEIFDPSWVSVLYESIQVWIKRQICPGWMLVPRKPQYFDNEYHTINCAKSKIIYNVEIVERKDQPRVMCNNEFEEKRATAGLMVRTTKPLCETGFMVFMDSIFCIPE